jgi:hypothetical protein
MIVTGRATGVVAAKVALHLFETATPSGVFHLEQMINPQVVLEELRAEGLAVIIDGLGTVAAQHSTIGE